MRIASSQVDMSSSRFYSQMGVKSGNLALGKKSFAGVAAKAYGNMSRSNDYGNMSSSKADRIGQSDETSKAADNFSYNVLGSMMQRLMGGGAFNTSGFNSGGFNAGGFSSSGFNAGGISAGGGYAYQLMTYQESESTTFSAMGTAVTEDGRQIDFGVNVSMSRKFMQYMNVQIPAMENALTDPLVINIGTDSAKVSDQKFKFDIDLDGVEDNIAMPTKGSAFLAYDKNEDGIINDGSELFGTASGDGFKDLSQYDSDGNGWIDENDEIFSKLKVWYKDENGKDVMMNLKEADVGAIFLGEQDSEFTLGDQMGNTSAVIRSSGIFLRESGTVGTIQHVDIAKVSDSEMALSEAGESAGALTLDLGDNNTFSSNRTRKSQSRKAEAEAIRAKKAARKKLMEEQIEKRRMERKEMQEDYHERILEHHKMYMEAMGL